MKQSDKGLYEECAFNEYGEICANSAATMSRYRNRPETMRRMLLTDIYGRDWVSCRTYGYIDRLGTVHICGRCDYELYLDDGTRIPLFGLENAILQDIKNVLSCTVCARKQKKGALVNIQMQPDSVLTEAEIRERLLTKLRRKFGDETEDGIIFRFFPFRESLPLTEAGKRSLVRLSEEDGSCISCGGKI